jgi:hypothetical protein
MAAALLIPEFQQRASAPGPVSGRTGAFSGSTSFRDRQDRRRRSSQSSPICATSASARITSAARLDIPGTGRGVRNFTERSTGRPSHRSEAEVFASITAPIGMKVECLPNICSTVLLVEKVRRRNPSCHMTKIEIRFGYKVRPGNARFFRLMSIGIITAATLPDGGIDD